MRKSRYAPLIFAMAGVLSMIAQGAASALPAGARWDLAEDFRLAPKHHNPSPDRYGNKAVWSYLSGESTYRRLPDFGTEKFDIPGLQSWWGEAIFDPNNRLPAVGINATGDDVDVYDILWPVGEVLVHPLGGEDVVVAWRSPITGNVTISGRSSLPQHPNCGNGVNWSLRDGDDVLTSGTLTEFDIADWVIRRNHVSRGDFLYFVVDARDGDFSCDNTLVSLTITKYKGPHTG